MIVLLFNLLKKSKSALSLRSKDINSSDPELPTLITDIDSASEELNITCNTNKGSYSGIFLTNVRGEGQIPTASVGSYFDDNKFIGFMSNAYYGLMISVLNPTDGTVNGYVFDIDKMVKQGFLTKLE